MIIKDLTLSHHDKSSLDTTCTFEKCPEPCEKSLFEYDYL